jgi:hypothetical protein
MKNRDELQGCIRVLVLDSLVTHSGKPLVPDVIGAITQELVARIIELLDPKL